MKPQNWTMADEVRELGRRLIQQRRLGLPRNVDDLSFEVDFPEPVTAKPFEVQTLVDVSVPCVRCCRTIVRLIPLTAVRRDMTMDRILCNLCAGEPLLETPPYRGAF